MRETVHVGSDAVAGDGHLINGTERIACHRSPEAGPAVAIAIA
jgi:hypothetical protein